MYFPPRKLYNQKNVLWCKNRFGVKNLVRKTNKMSTITDGKTSMCHLFTTWKNKKLLVAVRFSLHYCWKQYFCKTTIRKISLTGSEYYLKGSNFCEFFFQMFFFISRKGIFVNQVLRFFAVINFREWGAL